MVALRKITKLKGALQGTTAEMIALKLTPCIQILPAKILLSSKKFKPGKNSPQIITTRHLVQSVAILLIQMKQLTLMEAT